MSIITLVHDRSIDYIDTAEQDAALMVSKEDEECRRVLREVWWRLLCGALQEGYSQFPVDDTATD